MLESVWIAIPVSTLLGFLSGLGTGGGSLLILWLTMAVGMAQRDARAINLLFFIPSAMVACWFRWKQGTLKFGPVIPAILAGCTTAACFSWVSTIIDVGLLEKLFGVLLLFAGVREVLYNPRE